MGKNIKFLEKEVLKKLLKNLIKIFFFFLGQLPLNDDLRSSADKGEPLTYFKPDHEISKLFKTIAERIKQSFQ